MTGMTFIRLPSWELKKKETTTAKNTTVMQISSFLGMASAILTALTVLVSTSSVSGIRRHANRA